MTVHELQAVVDSFSEQPDLDTGRSLEEYLRALWRLVQEERESEVTYSWVATALSEGFVVSPAPFEPGWFDYTRPPDKGEALDDFEFLHQIFLFQIADLRRMAGNQLVDSHRGLGVRSPTGNSWYNFEPLGYLECAMRGFADNLAIGKLREYERNCDWRALAIILELGRLYE